MKRKISLLLSLVMIIISIVAFSACTKKTANTMGDFDAFAKVENNGSPVVKKGKYIYFANGYQDKFEKNEWGKPLKGTLYRAEVDEKGHLKKDSQKQFVPTIIWMNEKTNETMGLYIYGDWIYYISPNIDRNSNGEASKTHLDFWRTKLDGKVTQKIHTIDKREVEYIFKENHLIYLEDKTLYTLDFSPLNKVKKNSYKINNKVQKNLKKLSEYVTDSIWNINSDYIYYTVRKPDDFGDDNELEMIDYKGKEKKVIIPRKAYLTEEEKQEPEKHKDKTPSFRLISWLKNDRENSILYQKTFSNSVDGTFSRVYANTILEDGSIDIKNEKQMCFSERAKPYFYFLGINEGLLEFDSQEVLYHDGIHEKKKFHEKEIRVIGNKGKEIIYTQKDISETVYKGECDGTPHEIEVKGVSIKRNYVNTVLFDKVLYYFNDKDGYLYSVDISSKENKPEKISIEEKKEDEGKKK